MKLSIIVPCYNEKPTLDECVRRVESVFDGRELEVIIVDDRSSDRSVEIARELQADFGNLVILEHAHNQGKGAAIRTGLESFTGDAVAIQDADLEYDPNDLRRMIDLIEADEADVVFGSRYLPSETRRVLRFWHTMGNRILTVLSNMFTDLHQSDMEVCYKMFRREVINRITIQENRYGFEPEVVAKVAKLRVRISEVAISYVGRTYAEGKKIHFRDALRAVYCIIRYNVFD